MNNKANEQERRKMIRLALTTQDRDTFDTAMVCLGLKKVSQLYRVAKKEGVKS